MKIFTTFGLLLLSLVRNTQGTAFEKNLVSTPPMGWNSFDSYAIYINEEQAHQNLDLLVL